MNWPFIFGFCFFVALAEVGLITAHIKLASIEKKNEFLDIELSKELRGQCDIGTMTVTM